MTDNPPAMIDPIEAMCRAHAKADGLDWDEVCGLEADPLGECDTGTCIATCYEDHDAGYARAVYRQQATAAYAALRETLVPVGWMHEHERGESVLSRKPMPRGADELGWTETPLFALPEIKDAD